MLKFPVAIPPEILKKNTIIINPNTTSAEVKIPSQAATGINVLILANYFEENIGWPY